MSDLERIRRLYAKQAPRYDRMMRLSEKLFDIPRGRAWTCGGARGATLEVGVGTGLNLPHYPPDINLTAIDLTPEMLALARARSDRLGRAVAFREADAGSLPFADAQFDTVVSTLTLCTVPDPVAAVREAVRVCRPGGQLRFFEHGLASNVGVRTIERLLQPLTLRLEGDRLLLDPTAIFADAGVSARVEGRYNMGIFWRVTASPSAIGDA